MAYRYVTLVLLAAILSVFSTVHAATTFTVNSTNDVNDGTCDITHCSLREAVIAANAASGSTVNIPAGTYTFNIPGTNEDAALTGDLDINANMTIVGADDATTIIDAAQLDRVFHITGPYTVTFSNMTISNGRIVIPNPPGDYGSGILSADNVTLTITNSTLTNNRTEGQYSGGGAVVVGLNSAAVITNSTITGNYSRQTGGGILNGGTLTVNNIHHHFQ